MKKKINVQFVERYFLEWQITGFNLVFVVGNVLIKVGEKLKMIKIEIEGGLLHENNEEEDKPIILETDNFHNLNEVIKCIIKSGYVIKVYKLFDGREEKDE